VKLLSRKIGKTPSDPYNPEQNIYRQVYDIKFVEKSGKTIETITIADATTEECSAGYVDIFVVRTY